MVANQRKYTAQFKAKVGLEVLQGEKSPADSCCTCKLPNSVLTRWKREFVERSHHVFEVLAQVAQEEGKVAELERRGDNSRCNWKSQKRHRNSGILWTSIVG